MIPVVVVLPTTCTQTCSYFLCRIVDDVCDSSLLTPRSLHDVCDSHSESRRLLHNPHPYRVTGPKLQCSAFNSDNWPWSHPAQQCPLPHPPPPPLCVTHFVTHGSAASVDDGTLNFMTRSANFVVETENESRAFIDPN